MARKSMQMDGQTPARILILDPQEVGEGSRTRRMAEMCAELCSTHVLSWSQGERPAREYDGNLYLERLDGLYFEGEEYRRSPRDFHPFERYLSMHRLLRPLTRSAFVSRAFYRSARSRRGHLVPWDPDRVGTLSSLWARAQEAILDWHEDRDAVSRHLERTRAACRVSEILYTRARATSVVPRVVIACGAPALWPAIRLKRLYGCPVLYDSPEVGPELHAGDCHWLFEASWHLERELVRRCDRVVTSTPDLARLLERWYGLQRVVSVPTVDPLGSLAAAPHRAGSAGEGPIRFLLQGDSCPGHGVERLLQQWVRLEEPRAVLQVNSPDSAFLTMLRQKYRAHACRGRVAFPPAGTAAADREVVSQADVGVLPYPGPCLNHVYTCPGETSRYLQAGLALLYHSDQRFVHGLVEQHPCGLPYHLDEPGSLARAVRQLLDPPQALREMQECARHCGVTWLNWDTQAAPYREAVRDLFERGGRVHG